GGAHLYSADRMDLQGTIVATGQRVTLQPYADGRQINLGPTTDAGNSLELADAELDRITAATVQIGSASSGSITVSAAVSAPAGWNTLALQTGDAVIDGNAAGADLTALNLVIRAAAGIGSADALDTRVSNLAFSNTTSGAAQFNNAGGLNVASG